MNPTLEAAGRLGTQTKRASLAPEEFLTTKELMQLLKIRHKQTIYRLIREGLPVIAVGKNLRFIKQEVVGFLKTFSKKRNMQRKGRSLRD